MEKGEVQFGILAPPFDLIAERRGYEMLLALPGLGIPWQQNGEIVPTAYLKANRDNVVRFLRATAEGRGTVPSPLSSAPFSSLNGTRRPARIRADCFVG
jgi:hypothetical protein